MNESRLPRLSCVAGLSTLLVLTGPAQATFFLLGVTGPDFFAGQAGDPWSGSYLCTLTSSGGDTGTGAQAWSISLTADRAAITDITIDGTDAAALYNGGFKRSELTVGPGNEGAVSAVVLDVDLPITLVPDTTSSIASIQVAGTIPSTGTGSAILRYVDGRKGSGQPVPNTITTQDGSTIQPALGQKLIELRLTENCCNKPLNVGFSVQKVASDKAYDGIVDDGEGKCSGAGGEIRFIGRRGETPSVHVYANISSQQAGDCVQGWSFSIALSGDMVFGPEGVTTNGTSVDTYFSGGFKKTEIVDPVRNGGDAGAVSAIVLSFTEPRTLPPTGTETVLDLNVKPTRPLSDPDPVGELLFRTLGRREIQNALTVGGGSQLACNFATAQVTIRFGHLLECFVLFLRGDANNDSKIDIADPIWIINELFKHGPAAFCQGAADANGDGSVDAADAVYLIAYLLLAGTQPPEPFPSCGLNLTCQVDDSLPCEDGRGCR